MMDNGIHSQTLLVGLASQDFCCCKFIILLLTIHGINSIESDIRGQATESTAGKVAGVVHTHTHTHTYTHTHTHTHTHTMVAEKGHPPAVPPLAAALSSGLLAVA